MVRDWNSLSQLSRLAIAALLLCCSCSGTSSNSQNRAAFNDTNEDFWKRWGDGRAELSAYDFTQPRYGELRKGLAVSIFVTEDFSLEEGVKSDTQPRPEGVVPVLKLNLVEDFPTGVYDYNLMTSVFSALSSTTHYPLGSTLKVSFSSQEWCGHVYQQLRRKNDTLESNAHSYFSGEGDRSEQFRIPRDGVLEDSLWHWARGFSPPFLRAGEEAKRPLFSSLKTLRLAHKQASWEAATFSRSAETHRTETTSEHFETSVYEVAKEDGTWWKFYVEVQRPHRIIKWENSEGESAVLIRSKRMKYWTQHDSASISVLSELGLGPRAPRTP